MKVQETALVLLESLRLVSHAEFADGIRSLILDQAQACDGPVGLYAEREVRSQKGIPDRLFKEHSRRKSKRRAYGMGPQPVLPRHRKRPEVGSEGLVAQLITDLCRAFPDLFRSHPGPDVIRRDRVRAFFLVTDFIGSGNRVSKYLTAAWRLRTVKSWASLGLLRFEILAYSGTEAGLRAVSRHRSSPKSSVVLPCPTVTASFAGRASRVSSAQVRRWCCAFDPVDGDPVESLGYDGCGALIAFAHGIPNCAPRILHKRGRRRWKPLFPGRSTFRLREAWNSDDDIAPFVKRLRRLGEGKIAEGPWLRETHSLQR